MHLRLIDENGETTSRCTIADFVRDNAEDDESIYAMARALIESTAHPDPVTYGHAHAAHHWLGGGASPTVGIVVEDGPLPPREPQPDDVVCSLCGGMNVQVLEWMDANTQEYQGGNDCGGDDDTWCSDCEQHNGVSLREDYDRRAKAAKGAPTDATS